ncbi:rRNA methyltransferase [Alicyclobacillus cellulosilyticus]|uniref:rRNA methyltransferase n=1 Tax=Alicyclobacillus cellulosilyticus TaxID=1003997 RepID=A0A917KFV1_9BACL|nr:rRNA methyltransferase [Alicyclobacillus cellulosilyticus]
MHAVMFLESPRNPRVKRWADLKTRKGREASGEFLIEGRRLVRAALASPIEVTALLWHAGGPDPAPDLIAQAEAAGIPAFALAPAAFAAVADTVTSQGILAVARIPDPDTLRMRQDREAAGVGAGAAGASAVRTALLLDGVQDPGNVGTLIRAAEAFGVDEVCCGTGTADPFSPKVVRAAMGGLFHLPARVADSVAYVEAWRRAHPGGAVVVTDAAAPVDCAAWTWATPFLVVVGGEASGVHPEVERLATARVRIPMSGRAESLNAAMAGAIVLYEAQRQRLTRGEV